MTTNSFDQIFSGLTQTLGKDIPVDAYYSIINGYRFINDAKTKYISMKVDIQVTLVARIPGSNRTVDFGYLEFDNTTLDLNLTVVNSTKVAPTLINS